MLQTAFADGLELVRAAGFEVGSNEVPVLAAWFVFERHATPKQFDPRFSASAPRYAQILILEALIAAEKGGL